MAVVSRRLFPISDCRCDITAARLPVAPRWARVCVADAANRTSCMRTPSADTRASHTRQPRYHPPAISRLAKRECVRCVNRDRSRTIYMYVH